MSATKSSNPARITMLPSGKQFEALPGRSLLDAGLSAGIALPFGCANGSCGDCRAHLLDGEVEKISQHDFSLTEVEKMNGTCLLCSNTAVSDCQIEVIEATSCADIPQQQLTARLCRLEHAEDAHIVAVKFSRGKALRFLPGQWVNLRYADGFTIDLPIASCPCNAHALEFHLSADYLDQTDLDTLLGKFGEGGTRERLQVTGPQGQFTLADAVHSPKLFIASGGDFAQLQGLIEQVFNLDLEIPSCLLWKESAHTGHYLHNLCRSWQDALDEFDYVPLPISSDVLAHLPIGWIEHLPSLQVYLGRYDEQIIQALTTLGVMASNVFYPESEAG